MSGHQYHLDHNIVDKKRIYQVSSIVINEVYRHSIQRKVEEVVRPQSQNRPASLSILMNCLTQKTHTAVNPTRLTHKGVLTIHREIYITVETACYDTGNSVIIIDNYCNNGNYFMFSNSVSLL